MRFRFGWVGVLLILVGVIWWLFIRIRVCLVFRLCRFIFWELILLFGGILVVLDWLDVVLMVLLICLLFSVVD